MFLFVSKLVSNLQYYQRIETSQLNYWVSQYWGFFMMAVLQNAGKIGWWIIHLVRAKWIMPNDNRFFFLSRNFTIGLEEDNWDLQTISFACFHKLTYLCLRPGKMISCWCRCLPVFYKIVAQKKLLENICDLAVLYSRPCPKNY